MKLRNIKEFLYADPVRHTFGISMFEKEDSKIETFKKEGNIVGYVIIDGDYLVVNFTSDIDDEGVREAREIILKRKKERDTFIDFTCDEYTSKRLLEDEILKGKVEVGVHKLAYLLGVEAFKINHNFTTIEVDEYRKHIEFRNKIFNSNVPIVKNRYTEEEAQNTIVLRGDNGEIIFACSCTGYDRKTSMIIGVGTDEKYRGRGIASEGMKVMSRRILENQGIPVLFYKDPGAEKVYKRLGFRDTGYDYNIIKFV